MIKLKRIPRSPKLYKIERSRIYRELDALVSVHNTNFSKYRFYLVRDYIKKNNISSKNIYWYMRDCSKFIIWTNQDLATKDSITFRLIKNRTIGINVVECMNPEIELIARFLDKKIGDSFKVENIGDGCIRVTKIK